MAAGTARWTGVSLALVLTALLGHGRARGVAGWSCAAAAAEPTAPLWLLALLALRSRHSSRGVAGKAAGGATRHPPWSRDRG